MYIEQGFASSPPPPTIRKSPFDRLDEEPRYPLTRLQKAGARVVSAVFALEGVATIGEGEYVGGGILVGLSLAGIALSKWGEWKNADSARIPDIMTGDIRDKYGQPMDNRG